MITLNNGLKTSLIILELLRNDPDFEGINIAVNCFQNCREMGLTFDNVDSKDNMTYCVYEHRNSDQIIINGKKNWIGITGDLPFTGETKYDYIMNFRYDEYYKCYLKLKELLLKGVKK